GSVVVTSCATTSSRLDSHQIVARSSVTGPCATTPPRCRTTTAEQRRSTKSRTWALSRIIWTRPARVGSRWRGTCLGEQARVEDGSARVRRHVWVVGLVGWASGVGGGGERRMGRGGQSEQLEQRVDLARAGGGAHPPQAGDQIQLVASGEERVQVRFFRHVADARFVFNESVGD